MGFVGFEMSAACRTMVANRVTAVLSSGSKSFLSPLSTASMCCFSWFKCSICMALSVPRTAFIRRGLIRFKTAWSVMNRWFSFLRRWKAKDTCMFSSGERSLYSKANSWWTPIRYEFGTPGCPTSCTAAASSSARLISGFANLSWSCPVVRKYMTACATSAAWVALWYGFLWYPLLTCRMKLLNLNGFNFRACTSPRCSRHAFVTVYNAE
mmetsp:Transcript_7913/g.22493  ORF Transcript_7913/g.22493 Transcript_7913/m.22493 type:complete len:210 (-) Transcript_7913:841-1470(-)